MIKERNISKQAQADLNDIIEFKTADSERKRQRAFGRVYSRHAVQIEQKLLRKTRNPELAQDLTSETFEKAYAKIDKFDETKAVFSTWLHTIAYNTLVDNSRRQRHEVFSLDEIEAKTAERNNGMELQIPSEQKNPEEKMILSQDVKKMLKVIDGIKDDLTREVMKKRFIEGLSFDEIADDLDHKANSTLRVKAKRGLQLLKDAMKK